MKRLAISLFAAALAIAPWPAPAAPITLTLDFTLTNFLDIGFFPFAPAPYDPIVGSLTVTFDPTADVAPTSNGLTVNSLNFGTDSPLQFSYLAAPHLFSFGGADGGPGIVSPDNVDLVLQVDLTNLSAPSLFTCFANFDCGSYTGDPLLLASGYTVGDGFDGWFAQDGSVTVREPATFALFGPLILAVVRWRRPVPILLARAGAA